MPRRCKGCGRFRKQLHKCPTPLTMKDPNTTARRMAHAERIRAKAKSKGVSMLSLFRMAYFSESNQSNFNNGLSSDHRYVQIESIIDQL